MGTRRLKNWLCFLAFLIVLLQTLTVWIYFQVGEEAPVDDKKNETNDPYLLETPSNTTLSLAQSTTFQLRNNTTSLQSSSVNHWCGNFVHEVAVSFKKWQNKYSWCLKDNPRRAASFLSRPTSRVLPLHWVPT
jgi:hypothetical protein